MWPGAAVASAGMVVGALAAAFYCHHGAWGSIELAGKPDVAAIAFVDALRGDTEYVTCLLRFGRVFGGLGLLVLAWGGVRFGILPMWNGWLAALVGVSAMALTMALPDHLRLYMPIFHANVLWLLATGIVPWHRINHRVPLFWRFHAVHHSDADMDASSGVRFHTIEMVFSFRARLAILPLIGVTIPQLLLYEAISLPVILFHHSNLRLSSRADRALRWLIVTPWMHYVHHSRWQPETDSNYSSFLSIWDRLFGSFRLREKPAEIALGLDHYEEHECRGLIGLLLSPFKKRPRDDGSRHAPKE